MGVELGETNLTLQGFGEGGGLYILSGGWMLHAVRQVGLTGGIQQDAGWLSVDGCLRGEGCGGRLFRNLT